MPFTSASTSAEPGQPERGRREREQEHAATAAVATVTLRRPGAAPAAPPRLAGDRLDQRVDEPEEPEREQDRGDIRQPMGGRPAKPPATISTSLTKSGDGGSPASVPSESPIAAPSAGCGAADAAGRVPAGARLVSEQRRRRVEAERLRDRVPDDVDGDAGERERRAEADPERDHAHVLEARVGEQPLPGERPPEERDRDRERDEPEGDQHVLAPCARRSPARAPAPSARRRAAPPAAAPPRAARRRAAGASECASGSQLCTGAQPILAASPASRSR